MQDIQKLNKDTYSNPSTRGKVETRFKISPNDGEPPRNAKASSGRTERILIRIETIVTVGAIVLNYLFPQYYSKLLFVTVNILCSVMLLRWWLWYRHGLSPSIAALLVLALIWVGGVASAIFGGTSMTTLFFVLTTSLVLAAHIFLSRGQYQS